MGTRISPTIEDETFLMLCELVSSRKAGQLIDRLIREEYARKNTPPPSAASLRALAASLESSGLGV